MCKYIEETGISVLEDYVKSFKKFDDFLKQFQNTETSVLKKIYKKANSEKEEKENLKTK